MVDLLWPELTTGTGFFNLFHLPCVALLIMTPNLTLDRKSIVMVYQNLEEQLALPRVLE